MTNKCVLPYHAILAASDQALANCTTTPSGQASKMFQKSINSIFSDVEVGRPVLLHTAVPRQHLQQWIQHEAPATRPESEQPGAQKRWYVCKARALLPEVKRRVSLQRNNPIEVGSSDKVGLSPKRTGDST